MLELTRRNKTIETSKSALTLLKNAVDEMEKESHAAILTWCGTDADFYEEVVGYAPEVELTENSYILGNGDSFAVVNKDASTDDINDALKKIGSNLYIKEA